MTRRRKLHPEERALWDRVARQAVPLHPAKRPSAPRALQKPDPEPVRSAESYVPPLFEVGQSAPDTHLGHVLAPDLPAQFSAQPVAMDRKKHGHLKRGKLKPEARIDLHGMTMDRAHPALIRFILSSQGAGKRLVLVITGKGKHRDDDGPIPVRHGVLKHNVPQWLSLPPLSQAVLQVTPAHARHGGSGAYYVYLRRRR
jgi:DNA-nicking Smr family endonuclease